MTSIEKGRQAELAVQKVFEAAEYVADRKVRVRHHSPDFFGLFDILCWNRIGVTLVQVKLNSMSNVYSARKEIAEYVKDHDLDVCSVRVLMVLVIKEKGVSGYKMKGWRLFNKIQEMQKVPRWVSLGDKELPAYI